MTARMLVRVCSILEVATGVALIANPDFVVRALFGVGLSGDVAIARRAGIGPLLLGLMCWPRGDDIPTPVIWAQLTYNLLVALYLGYLRIDGKFVSNALWTSSGLHAVLALLLAGAVFGNFAAKPGRVNQH